MVNFKTIRLTDKRCPGSNECCHCFIVRSRIENNLTSHSAILLMFPDEELYNCPICFIEFPNNSVFPLVIFQCLFSTFKNHLSFQKKINREGFVLKQKEVTAKFYFGRTDQVNSFIIGMFILLVILLLFS